MKKINLIVLIVSIISITGCNAQNTDIEKVKEVITFFSDAGDKNDSKKLETYLDTNYRIVMNRLFGSNSVTIMSKTTFLQKIESKEYGGDKRELIIENVVINGTTASAKVTFKGTKMTFVSILVLLKNKDNKWKLLSDIPIVK